MKDRLKEKPQATNRMVHVRINDELHRRVRILVAARDETIQDWLSGLIAREVEQLGSDFTTGGQNA